MSYQQIDLACSPRPVFGTLQYIDTFSKTLTDFQETNLKKNYCNEFLDTGFCPPRPATSEYPHPWPGHKFWSSETPSPGHDRWQGHFWTQFMTGKSLNVYYLDSDFFPWMRRFLHLVAVRVRTELSHSANWLDTRDPRLAWYGSCEPGWGVWITVYERYHQQTLIPRAQAVLDSSIEKCVNYFLLRKQVICKHSM